MEGLTYSRSKDHESVAVLTCYRRLCPMLAPCTNKDNDGDTPCIVSYICFLLRHFEDRSIRSKQSPLMSQHGGLSFMAFMERQRTAFPSKFSYVSVMLPTSSTGPMESRTTAQNLRVHRFGDCKPQFA